MTDTTGALTPAEVAERIGASEWFVKRLAREGTVEHLRVDNRKVRFTEEQYEALVAHLTKQPLSAAQSLATSRSRRARRRA